MKKNVKQFLFFLLLPLVLGFVIGTFTSSADYQTLTKPLLAPPSTIFPIVWTVLYLLMGISSYLIFISDSKDKVKALTVYYLQLIVNLMWSIFFFTLKCPLFSFFWILLLIVLVIWMLFLFYQINKKAFYLQIPYLLWLCFAAYLNFSIYLLNY